MHNTCLRYNYSTCYKNESINTSLASRTHIDKRTHNFRFRFVNSYRVNQSNVRGIDKKQLYRVFVSRTQRRRRHARYAFHVRLKNSREECKAENSEERRAAARATLALRCRPPPSPLRRTRRAAAGALPHALAPLFTSFHEIHSLNTRPFYESTFCMCKQPRFAFRVTFSIIILTKVV